MADIVFPGAVPSGVLGSDSIPSNYDLLLYRGDAFTLYVNLTDSTGAAINLTGYTAKATIKKNYQDTSPVSLTVTISNPTGGAITILLPSTASVNLAAGSYIWDFKVTDPSNNVRTYLTGDVTVYDEVN